MGRILANRIQQTKPFDGPAHEAMLNLFIAGAHVRRAIEQVCRSYDLQFSHYNVLRILRGAHPDGYARCDIIDRMLDPSPDVTRLMDKLEDLGCVSRRRSETDRRVTLHFITEDGVALLEEIDPDIQAVQDDFAASVSERDLAHLSRICEGIYSNMARPDSEQ
jgi:DNA-binding MarR family transcriptional regulator